MKNSSLAPVMAGLAVGIIFVVLISLFFNSASPIPKNSVKWAIDKTKDLSEVKVFLRHYPDATTTVYFVTACATDEVCNTLMRVPSIVEYSHQAAEKVALLRISIAVDSETAPTSFLQLSCQMLDAEVADEIHDSRLSDNDISDFLQNHQRCP